LASIRLGYVMIFDMRIAKPGPKSRDWSVSLQEGVLRLTSNESPPPIIDSAALLLIEAVHPRLLLKSVEPTLELKASSIAFFPSNIFAVRSRAAN